jgi:hypothetical protein
MDNLPTPIWFSSSTGSNRIPIVLLFFCSHLFVTEHKRRKHKVKINFMLNRFSFVNNKLLKESYHQREDESHFKQINLISSTSISLKYIISRL